jgi:Protein kinase domain
VSNAAYALPDRELVLDRYRPLRPIGRGGSGSVWLARDERSGLEIALKIVPREGKRAARAMREMEAASRLRHRRCVRAYDFGGDDGHVYIAYEYVPGSTMRELMRAGRLTDVDAVEAAAQVLEGLAHAHQQGIVHRDVKPSNIMVEDGATLSVRLLDFGLAQFDDADTLTNVGDVPGTLAYIAPERLTGQDASTRSDVWAVGVLLWEALAGQHPFWGVPLPQVASSITGGAPSLSSRRPDLPRRLLAIVDAALAVAPAKRPSAKRLAHELREAYASPRRERESARKSPPRLRAGQPTRSTKRRHVPLPSAAPVAHGQRLLHAAGAAVATAFAATALPFWPPGLVALLALSAGAAALRFPRLALAIVLFAPVFPLGNLSSGAALAYAVATAIWFAAIWTDRKRALLFCAGPALAMVGLLAALPLVAATGRRPVHRALHAIGGVLAAALMAGLHGRSLPFAGAPAPSLSIDREESAVAVTQAAWNALASSPGTLAGACVIAITATMIPWARAKGHVEAAVLVALQLVALMILAREAPLAGVVVGTLALLIPTAGPRVLEGLRRRQSRPTAE